jgi:hypothetical protein
MTDGDAGAAEPLAFETGELPDLSEDNRLVLMAVDPYLLYAYWNVTSTRTEAAKALFEEDELEGHVLRFHDTTGIDFDGVNSRSSFDVSIQLDVRRWYVRLWSPEKRYCADIGLRAKDGRLVALARSNMVETPPDWPRVKVDEAAGLVEQGEPEAGAAQAAQPPEPAPQPAANSHEVLERKLAEVSALREEPLALEPEPAPSEKGGSGHGDLTQMSEKSFSPGVSSVLLGKRRSSEA